MNTLYETKQQFMNTCIGTKYGNTDIPAANPHVLCWIIAWLYPNMFLQSCEAPVLHTVLVYKLEEVNESSATQSPLGWYLAPGLEKSFCTNLITSSGLEESFYMNLILISGLGESFYTNLMPISGLEESFCMDRIPISCLEESFYTNLIPNSSLEQGLYTNFIPISGLEMSRRLFYST